MGNTAVSSSRPYTYTYAYQEPQPEGFAAYQPSDEQVERAKAWQRFTRLYVILPITLVAFIIFIFSLFLLYQAIWPATAQTRPLLSGVADILVILFLLMVTLFFAIILTAVFGAAFAYRKHRRSQPESALKEYGYIRILLWQIDKLIEKPIPTINKFSQTAADLTIKLNLKIAYLQAWLAQIKSWILRSEPNG